MYIYYHIHTEVSRDFSFFIFRKTVNSSPLAKCSKYVTCGHGNSFMFFRRNAISVEHTLPLHSKFTIVNRYVFSFSVFF